MGLWHVVPLFAVSLLHSCITQGPSAGTSVFVHAGKDLFLEVKESVRPEQGSHFTWRLNSRSNIVKIYGGELKTHSSYIGRAFVQNYSLLLKHAQENDSGVYSGCVSGDEEETIVEYKVTVQNPVSPVELTVDSVSGLSDSCNLTVTCRSQESRINSTVRCDTRTCSQEGGERSEVAASGTSLHVYLVNASIICNYSNQVSWTKEMRMTEDLCNQHYDSYVRLWSIVIVATITVMLIIILAAVYLRNRGKDKREMINNAESTVYEVPQVDATTRPPNHIQAGDLSPTSTYCLVGPHAGPVASTDTRGNTLLESLYAQVQKPART